MDPILNQLQSLEPEKKPWYLRWWGILFLLLLVTVIFILGIFLKKVNYYVEGFVTNDWSRIKDVYVDASGYSASGNQVSRIDVETGDDPFFGNPEAKVVVVEFGDFGCPFCKQNAPDLVKIRNEYADKIKFIWRDFPLTYLHPEALMAAEAASCANEQGMFWPYHDLLYSKQGQYKEEIDMIAYANDLGLDESRFKDCLSGTRYESEAQIDFQDGIRLGVKGTPTFYVNGVRLSGVVPYETFKKILDRYLEIN